MFIAIFPAFIIHNYHIQYLYVEYESTSLFLLHLSWSTDRESCEPYLFLIGYVSAVRDIQSFRVVRRIYHGFSSISEFVVISISNSDKFDNFDQFDNDPAGSASQRAAPPASQLNSRGTAPGSSRRCTSARAGTRWTCSEGSFSEALEGSFSAVSKPNFASRYAFESSRRDLHTALLCTALKSHFLKNC